MVEEMTTAAVPVDSTTTATATASIDTKSMSSSNNNDKNNNNNNNTNKSTTLAVVFAVAVVGLTLISMHGTHLENQTIGETQLKKYQATMHVDMRVHGELAQVLKAASDLSKQNKARLDALNSQVPNNYKKCEALINALTPKINVIQNSMDKFVVPAHSAQATLPHKLRAWKLAQPTQCVKNQLVGTFDFAGTNRYMIELEFKFDQRNNGQWSTIMWVGNGHNRRFPGIYIRPNANTVFIHVHTSASPYTVVPLAAHNMLAGRVYKLSLESTGFSLIGRVYGDSVDARGVYAPAGLKVTIPTGDQKVWMCDPWFPQAPKVNVIRSSLMTVD